jgi:hypothetical protein
VPRATRCDDARIEHPFPIDRIAVSGTEAQPPSGCNLWIDAMSGDMAELHAVQLLIRAHERILIDVAAFFALAYGAYLVGRSYASRTKFALEVEPALANEKAKSDLRFKLNVDGTASIILCLFGALVLVVSLFRPATLITEESEHKKILNPRGEAGAELPVTSVQNKSPAVPSANPSPSQPALTEPSKVTRDEAAKGQSVVESETEKKGQSSFGPGNAADWRPELLDYIGNLTKSQDGSSKDPNKGDEIAPDIRTGDTLLHIMVRIQASQTMVCRILESPKVPPNQKKEVCDRFNKATQDLLNELTSGSADKLRDSFIHVSSDTRKALGSTWNDLLNLDASLNQSATGKQ